MNPQFSRLCQLHILKMFGSHLLPNYGWYKKTHKSTWLILKNGAKLKFRIDEVSLSQIAEYSELVYNETSGTLGKRLYRKVEQRQEEVIAFMEQKVEELGLKDFL